MGRATGVPSLTSGEAVLALVRWRGARPPLTVPPRRSVPGRARALPGPMLLVASRLHGPAGPSVELAIARPVRVGASPRWSVVFRAVDAVWADPAVRAELRWESDGDARILTWAARDVVVRGRPTRVTWPVAAPVHLIGEPEHPAERSGIAKVGLVRVDAPWTDPLGAVAGRHLGLVVQGVRGAQAPARAQGRVVPLFSPHLVSRAPVSHASVAEPALSFAVPRAIGSDG